MKKQILLVTLCIISFQLVSQISQIIYTCPEKNSEFINPEQIIIIKATTPFKNIANLNPYINITGSEKGKYDFEYAYLDNHKVINIKTNETFIYGENVSLEINNLNLIDGTLISDKINFKIKSGDNLPLLKEYYIKQNQPIELIQELNSDSRQHIKLETPVNYPDPQINIIQEVSSDKHYFFTLSPRGGAPDYDNYLSINDRYGIPLFFRKTDYNTLNFHVLDNGTLTYASNRYSLPELEKYYFMDSSYVVTDSIKTVGGYNLDGHDMLLLDNGNYLLMSYDPQTVNMSTVVPGGNPSATVIGLVIQEVDLNGNLYFQWRSWDHFEITDATSDISLTAQSIDYVHGNAFDIDSDGNILLSSRHLDEITKIDFETGEVIYRMGLLAKNNEFTFIDDNLGFSHQHDVRLLPNGNISIYDNGNLHASQFSRALEYDIDETNKTATLVWSYRNNPDIYGMATGSYRRDNDGTHLIGWGSTWPLGGTELLSDNTIASELIFPTGVYSYRILKHHWETNLFATMEELDFGNYYEGPEYKRNIIPLANNSSQTIRINSHHLHSDNFEILDPLPVIVQPGDTTTVIIGFKPSGNDSYDDRLTLNYDKTTIESSERIARQLDLVGVWDPNKPVIGFSPKFGDENVTPDIEILINFSEPVRGFGGAEITDEDIPNIFLFKKDHQWGNDIGFSGTINNEATEISIIPDNILPENAQYYVELIASRLQTESGSLINYPEVTYFKTGTLVNVDGINESISVKVYPNPVTNQFVIDVAYEDNYNISVSNSLNQIVFSKKNSIGRSTVSMSHLPKGIYNVSISTQDGSITAIKVVKL